MDVILMRIREPGEIPLRRRVVRIGTQKIWVAMSMNQEVGFWRSDGKPAAKDWQWQHLRVAPESLVAIENHYK